LRNGNTFCIIQSAALCAEINHTRPDLSLQCQKVGGGDDVRWGGTEGGRLYGLPVLRARADPEGFWGEYRLRRAGRALGRRGAVRVLVPGGFDRWPLLEEFGLVPVDPTPLVRSQGAALALAALGRRGMDPAQATVALRGQRAGMVPRDPGPQDWPRDLAAAPGGRG